MAYPQYPTQTARPIPVATLDLERRIAFLRRVYSHLFGAVALLVAVETVVFSSGAADTVMDKLFGTGGAGTILLLVAILAGGYISTRAAYSTEPAIQYLGLAGEVGIWSFVAIPGLWYAFQSDQAGDIAIAAVITLLGFGGLTLIALTTKDDLSGLRNFVKYGFAIIFAVMVAGALFGFTLGVWFSAAAIAIAGAGILWHTQAILRTYPETMYVGAATSLFGYVMMMFMHLLRILNRR